MTTHSPYALPSADAAARPTLSLSIVSHGQAALVRHLLDDLIRLALPDVEVILTINITEDESVYPACPFPMQILRNAVPKGFGANHNAAFASARGQFFVVVNPDIRLPSLDLETLLRPLQDPAVAAIAPLILSAAGTVEDSARRFPTFVRLARRVFFNRREPDYQWDVEPIRVDWTAGMFVVFRPQAYAEVGGFDDRRFFMYLEDADICRRLQRRGGKVLLQPQVSVVHDARRASRRNLKHLRWHLTSAVRFIVGI